MAKNPTIEMMIFSQDEEKIIKSLKKRKFDNITVEHDAPEPCIRFSGKYSKVENWCEDFLGEFNFDDIEYMILNGEYYDIEDVEQDDDTLEWKPLEE